MIDDDDNDEEPTTTTRGEEEEKEEDEEETKIRARLLVGLQPANLDEVGSQGVLGLSKESAEGGGRFRGIYIWQLQGGWPTPG